MADYKDIFSDTLGKLAGKVKEAADTSGVLDVYAQGANRAKAFGQIAKLTLELNSEHDELNRIYTEIGLDAASKVTRGTDHGVEQRQHLLETREHHLVVVRDVLCIGRDNRRKIP